MIEKTAIINLNKKWRYEKVIIYSVHIVGPGVHGSVWQFGG